MQSQSSPSWMKLVSVLYIARIPCTFKPFRAKFKPTRAKFKPPTKNLQLPLLLRCVSPWYLCLFWHSGMLRAQAAGSFDVFHSSCGGVKMDWGSWAQRKLGNSKQTCELLLWPAFNIFQSCIFRMIFTRHSRILSPVFWKPFTKRVKPPFTKGVKPPFTKGVKRCFLVVICFIFRGSFTPSPVSLSPLHLIPFHPVQLPSRHLPKKVFDTFLPPDLRLRRHHRIWVPEGQFQHQSKNLCWNKGLKTEKMTIWFQLVSSSLVSGVLFFPLTHPLGYITHKSSYHPHTHTPYPPYLSFNPVWTEGTSRFPSRRFGTALGWDGLVYKYIL